MDEVAIIAVYDRVHNTVVYHVRTLTYKVFDLLGKLVSLYADSCRRVYYMKAPAITLIDDPEPVSDTMMCTDEFAYGRPAVIVALTTRELYKQHIPIHHAHINTYFAKKDTPAKMVVVDYRLDELVTLDHFNECPDNLSIGGVKWTLSDQVRWIAGGTSYAWQNFTTFLYNGFVRVE